MKLVPFAPSVLDIRRAGGISCKDVKEPMLMLLGRVSETSVGRDKKGMKEVRD